MSRRTAQSPAPVDAGAGRDRSGAGIPLLTLPEQIAERIYAGIVAGEPAPGERIREEELAARFEVSRGPVRQALLILERDAVVRILPNRGAHVTRLSAKEVNDIFEIRKVLSGSMARRLAGASRALMEPFRKKVEELEELAERADAAEPYVTASVGLSLGLAQASGNDRLAQMMRSLARQSWRYTQLALQSQARRKQSARNWKTLLNELLAGRAEAAGQAMEKLVDDSRREAVRLLASPDGEPGDAGAETLEPAASPQRRKRA